MISIPANVRSLYLKIYGISRIDFNINNVRTEDYAVKNLSTVCEELLQKECYGNIIYKEGRVFFETKNFGYELHIINDFTKLLINRMKEMDELILDNELLKSQMDHVLAYNNML